MRVNKIFLPLILLFYASIVSPIHSQVVWDKVLDGYGFQFIAQNSQETLYTIELLNSKFYYSSDTGSTWTQIQTNGLSSLLFGSLDFVNDSTMIMAGSSGIIRRTSDWGANWYFVSCSTCTNLDDFTKIQMLNSLTGYASGDQRIFKTTNGGLNFYSHFVSAPISTYKAFFINVNTGYAAALYRVFKTTDGALSWDLPYSTQNPYNYGIWFANENTGWVAGDKGYVHRTTDAGLTWASQQLDTFTFFTNINGLNENLLWVSGLPGSIYHSFDGGITWRKYNFPHDGYVNDVFFLDNNVGLVASEYGIFKTTNASVYINPNSEILPEKIVLYQNFPNPFNPITNFKFEINSNENIKLSLYDLKGKEIVVLINQFLTAGIYEYKFHANNLPSGVYFIALSNDNQKLTRKIALIK